MAVVLMHGKRGTFISALVCPGCEKEILVSFGRPEMA